MARTVRLASLQGVPIVPEDGGVGILVGLHPTVWLWYWLRTMTILGVTGASLWGLWHFDLLTPHPGILVTAGGILLVLGKVVVLGYYRLRHRFLLITPANVYSSRVEKWFWRVVDPTPIQRVKLDSSVEGWGILGVRRLTFTVEGDAPDIILNHSDLGATGVAHIHALTAEAT